jgi:hypothetical protein
MSQSAPTSSPIEEVAEFFAHGPSTAEIPRFQLSEQGQAWISELLEKEDAGALTAEERHELDELLIVQDLVNLIRSRIPETSPSPEAHQ